MLLYIYDKEKNSGKQRKLYTKSHIHKVQQYAAMQYHALEILPEFNVSLADVT
jgi:hypothetical protein